MNHLVAVADHADFGILKDARAEEFQVATDPNFFIKFSLCRNFVRLA